MRFDPSKHEDLRGSWPEWMLYDPDARKFRFLDEDMAYDQMERKAIKEHNELQVPL